MIEYTDTSKEESGATLLEYAMLACMLSLVAIVAVNRAGESVNGTFYHAGREIGAPNSPYYTTATGGYGASAYTTGVTGVSGPPPPPGGG